MNTLAKQILKEGYVTNINELYALASEYCLEVEEKGYTSELEFADGSKLIMYQDEKFIAK